MQEELGFTEEVKNQWGSYVSFTRLKERYERPLNRCNQFEEPADEEEGEETLVRNACIKTFLLLLVGYTIFANKNNKNVSLICRRRFRTWTGWTSDHGAG